MICIDTSTWSAYFEKKLDVKTSILEKSLIDCAVVLSPPILLELLSSSKFTKVERELLVQIPCLELKEGVWQRAGNMRLKLLNKGLRARSMDCLIAQCCMDHKVHLLSHDNDYKNYIPFGLVLVY